MSSRKKKHRRAANDPPRRERHANGRWIVALVLLTLAAYGRLLACDFTSWDDYDTVSRNPNITNPTADSLAYHWQHPHMDLYVPVTYTAWWALAAVSGADGAVNPAVFHGANVALHAASAAILFLLIRRLGIRPLPAFLGAAVFAVHPVQVEPVAWVSGMKDVLCGLLSLVSVWQYVEYAQAVGATSPSPGTPGEGRGEGHSYSSEQPRSEIQNEAALTPTLSRSTGRGRKTHYGIATLAFILALLAKPSAVVVPAIALVIDALVVRRPPRRSLPALAPWLLLSIACLLWTKAVQPAHYAASHVPLYLRPLIATDALAFYLSKLIWPAGLAVDYGRTPELAVFRGWVYYTWLAPAAVAALLLWRARKAPALLAGALVFVLGVAPVLGLVRFDFQLISTTADHYLYLSMAGVALAVAAWLNRAGRADAAIVAAVVVALAARAAVQAGHWRDTFTLFEHNLAVNPESWVAHNSLAAAYVEARQPAPALEHARRAAKMRADDARVWGTLGSALALDGKLPEAADAYGRALEIEPNNARLHAALAGLLAQQHQMELATAHARRAIELDPADADARLNYGTMLAQSGRVDEGIEQLKQAIRLAPGKLPQAHANLGMLYLSRRQNEAAAQAFRRALLIDPNFAPARAGLDRATAPAAR